jgi:hypothetical protein
MKAYFVCIMANRWHTTPYIGVMNSLMRRVSERRAGRGSFPAMARPRRLARRRSLDKLGMTEEGTATCGRYASQLDTPVWNTGNQELLPLTTETKRLGAGKHAESREYRQAGSVVTVQFCVLADQDKRRWHVVISPAGR